MVIFGGWDGKKTLDDLLEYDLATKGWRPLLARGTPPSNRYRHVAVRCRNHMFLFGGVPDKTKRFNDLHDLDLNSQAWCEVDVGLPGLHDFERLTASTPTPRTFHTMVADHTQNSLFLVGGYDGKERLRDIYRLDIGPRNPPTLTGLLTDYIRQNLTEVQEAHQYHPLPLEAGHVEWLLECYRIFDRDLSGAFRGACEKRGCRCPSYRRRHYNSPGADLEADGDSNKKKSKNSSSKKKSTKSMFLDNCLVCEFSARQHVEIDVKSWCIQD